MKEKKETGKERVACARATNLNVSTKHCIEISRFLRYKNTGFAKTFLGRVIALKEPVPFRRFRHNVGHKPGMAAGRYPQKAAKEFLKLIKSVEANAQVKGLNTANLKITKLVANKASIPLTGGRQRRGTKRSHLEIEVEERKELKKNLKKSEEKSTKEKSPEKQKEAKLMNTPKREEKGENKQ